MMALQTGNGPLFEGEERPSIRTVRADFRKAARDLGRREVRYLVDLYYQIQDYRKASANQVRALSKSEEPHQVITWAKGEMGSIEDTIHAVLDAWTSADDDSVAAWARTVRAIGPVISAGLAAHIDIERAPTVGHIWSFAGLNPTVRWEKGEKRPWNASLKTLAWKIGDSFVKFSGEVCSTCGKRPTPKHDEDKCVCEVPAMRPDPRCFFGVVYRDRKAKEVARNESGEHRELAQQELVGRTWRDKTSPTYEAYTAGVLPDGRIDLRARRYAVKLFLAEWHEEAYARRYGVLPPKPYAIDRQGHAHEIAFPDASPFVRGLRKAAGRPVADS